MTLELTALQAFITQFGLPLGALVIILWTGARGDWVFGGYHRARVEDLRNQLKEAKQEIAEWKRIGMRVTDVADNAVTMAAQQSPARGGT